MNLKLRLMVMLIAVISVTFFSAMYFIEIYPESNSFLALIPSPNPSVIIKPQVNRAGGSKQALIKTAITSTNVKLLELLIGNFEKNRTLQKGKSKRKKKVLNETDLDSDHAMEKLDDKGFEELLDEEEILSRFSKIRGLQKPDLRVRLIKECGESEKTSTVNRNQTNFPDLISILQAIIESPLFNSEQPRITLQEFDKVSIEKDLTITQKFFLRVSNQDVYEENDPAIDILLEQMATMPIVHVEEKSGGTQLKLLITYEDGSQTVLKPMRFDRDQETNPNHFHFNDFERHTSEIATFHLDRILGFRRCAPIVGRKLNIALEIYMVADIELQKTFFISPAKNICFHGHCKQYCDSSHAICGRPDYLEASLSAFIPADDVSKRQRWKNPWRRSYNKRRKADWETNSDFCQLVRQMPIYNNTKRLADVVDMHILDFLTGNMDRHHYETFSSFGDDSFIVHLDNGRGFGKPHHDEISILSPLIQCCFMHKTTFHRLMHLQHNGPNLSTLMFCSLSKDPLTPVLLDEHLAALDRRLQTVLQAICGCLQKHEVNQVFFGYDEE